MIDVKLPFPPSVNKAYATTRSGRRLLTSEGKLFKQSVRDIIGQKYAVATPELSRIGTVPLELTITLYTATENKGWLQGKAKNRYKRVDVSNRVKLLEDAVFESLDSDDCLVFSLHVHKVQSDDEYVHLLLKEESLDQRDGEESASQGNDLGKSTETSKP